MDSYNNHHHHSHHRVNQIMDPNYENIVYSNVPPTTINPETPNNPIHPNESMVMENNTDKDLECIAGYPTSESTPHEMLQHRPHIQHEIHEQALSITNNESVHSKQYVDGIQNEDIPQNLPMQEPEYSENNEQSPPIDSESANKQTKENLIKSEADNLNDGKIKTTSLKVEPINDDSEAGASTGLLIKKEATEIDQNQCRVCLTKNDLTNIFGYENDQRICDAIMTFCSVKISERDFLPHYVCVNCLEKIKIALSFKHDCENTDKELRAKLKRSKKTYRRDNPRAFVMVDCVLSSGEDKDPKDDDEFQLSEVPESEPESDASFEINKKKKVSKKKSPKKKIESRTRRETSVRSSSSNKVQSTTRTTRNSSRITTANHTPPKRFKHDVVFVEAPHLSESDASDTADSKNQQQKKLRGPRGPYKKKPSISVTEELKSSPAVLTPNKVNSSKIPHKKRAIKASDTDDDDIISNRSTSTTNSKTPSSTKKQYPCDICNKVFDSKTSRGEHSKIHIGEKPLSCYICQKGFKHKTPLESHIQKHKDDDSRTCKICDRMFGSKMELRKHQQTVHQDLYTFECEKCKRTFATKQRFDKHTESNCPGFDTTLVKKKTDESAPTLGRDLFKCVAPLTTTYWSDSFSE